MSIKLNTTKTISTICLIAFLCTGFTGFAHAKRSSGTMISATPIPLPIPAPPAGTPRFKNINHASATPITLPGQGRPVYKVQGGSHGMQKVGATPISIP